MPSSPSARMPPTALNWMATTSTIHKPSNGLCRPPAVVMPPSAKVAPCLHPYLHLFYRQLSNWRGQPAQPPCQTSQPYPKPLITLHVSSHCPLPLASRHGRAQPLRTRIGALALLPETRHHWCLFQHVPTLRRRREAEEGANLRTLAGVEDVALIDYIDVVARHAPHRPITTMSLCCTTSLPP
jgi:hypothetical protein